MNGKSYSATIDLFFDYNGLRERIPSENIVYLLIESDYDNQVLPIIYTTVSVDSNLYSKIIKYKRSARFYLNIKKINKSSNLSVYRDTISGYFSYIPSTTNPNYTEDLNVDAGSSYKRIMIGLVSIELTNSLRKTFNNVYSDIYVNDLINIALEGTKCIRENITYNKFYKSILIPPMASRFKLLNFVFNSDPFYDTRFRYFMDFEKSYLLSNSGNYVDAGDGQFPSIIVDIRSILENEAYYEGIDIKNNAYYVYINPVNSNVIIDQGLEKVANQIVAVDEDEGVKITDLNINITDGSDTKQMFVRTDNIGILKGDIETNTVIVEIVKQNIDGYIFTPNKCIYINNFSEYSKYNGKYIMIYKKEFYKCVAGEFVVSCNIGLKRVGNLDDSSTSDIKINKSSAVRKSTSNIKNTSRKNK